MRLKTITYRNLKSETERTNDLIFPIEINAIQHIDWIHIKNCI